MIDITRFCHRFYVYELNEVPNCFKSKFNPALNV